MRRTVSSTERPTGRSLTVICLQGREIFSGQNNARQDKDKLDAPQDTLGVDDEQSTKSNALLLEKDAVVAGDLHVPVGNERKREVRSETTLLAGLGGPCKVRELGVGRNTYLKDKTYQHLKHFCLILYVP